MSKNFIMEYQERKNGKLAIIYIQGIEPNNTLTGKMLEELLETMYEQEHKADILLISSKHPKFFSNGLDGSFLLQASPEVREQTISEMIRVYPKLVAFPMPWVAEITGYAMAGGAVIATAADYRYMISKGARIGFSELMMGLPLPVTYLHNIKNLVEPRYIRPIMEGSAYKPNEAERIGLVDAIAQDKDQLRALCFKRIDALLRLDRLAFLSTRNNYRQAIATEMKKDLEKDVSLAMEFVHLPAFENVLQNISQRNL